MTPLFYTYLKTSANALSKKTPQTSYLLLRNSWIPFAAALPAPIARITVAAPVTASPPAYTPSFDVFPVSSSAIIHFLFLFYTVSSIIKL